MIKNKPLNSLKGPVSLNTTISGKFPSVLILLALMTTLTPITSSYTFLFFLFLWLLWNSIPYNLPILRKQNSAQDRKTKNSVEILYRQYLVPFNVGIAIFAFLQLISAIGAYFTSKFEPSAKEVFVTSWHLLGKWVAIWIVLSQSIALLLRRGWNPQSIFRNFFVWILIYGIYCLAQRTWGIDWVRGFDAVLGDKRLAYGVYRISGMMSHPLTLTYNLMILFFLSFSLGTLAKKSTKKKKSWVKNLVSWNTVAMISIIILVASGSRFVLLVIPPTILIAYSAQWYHWLKEKLSYNKSQYLRKIFSTLTLIIILFIFVGHSSISRFMELFDPQIPWHDRWPRLIYWKIHWDIFLSHPLFGVSVAKISTAAETFGQPFTQPNTSVLSIPSALPLDMMNAHNLFLQFLADSGFVGFIGLCILTFCLFQGSRKPELHPQIRRGLNSIVIGFIGASISQNVLRDSEFVFAFWLSIALLLAFSAHLLQEPQLNTA